MKQVMELYAVKFDYRGEIKKDTVMSLDISMARKQIHKKYPGSFIHWVKKVV